MLAGLNIVPLEPPLIKVEDVLVFRGLDDVVLSGHRYCRCFNF